MDAGGEREWMGLGEGKGSYIHIFDSLESSRGYG
jgi:hypothetical protein